MKPPNGSEPKGKERPTQNGVNAMQSSLQQPVIGEDTRSGSDTWDQQRTRIDGLLSTLKKEMQEVKVMDKNLTRQFIHLGGKIQELKAVEQQLYEQMSMEESEFDNEEELISDNNNETAITVLEDTRL